jgi:hypothetical protein
VKRWIAAISLLVACNSSSSGRHVVTRTEREEFVREMQGKIGSRSAIRLEGSDGDVMVLDMADCNRAALVKLDDIPNVHNDLSRLRIVSLKCLGGDELPIVWD